MAEFPPEWKSTLDDLADQVRSGRILTPQELGWALAYERSQWPSGLRLPQQGDEYETLDDVNVGVGTHWRTAFTDGFAAAIPKGTRVRVYLAPAPGAVAVPATPIDYAALEAMLIPESDRQHPKYAGYSLTIKILALHEKFRLLGAP